MQKIKTIDQLVSGEFYFVRRHPCELDKSPRWFVGEVRVQGSSQFPSKSIHMNGANVWIADAADGKSFSARYEAFGPIPKPTA